MTILQAHKYYRPRDGASKYMLQVSDQLASMGHTVIPFAMDEGASTLDTPYRTYFVSPHDLSNPQVSSIGENIHIVRNMMYSREAKKQMELLLADYPVDIAHIHNIYHHISPSILVALKKRGIPIVMTLHDYKLIAPNYTLFHHGEVHEENAHGMYLSNIWQRSLKDSVVQSTIVTAEMIFHHKVMRYYERFVDHFISPSQFLIDTCVRHGWSHDRFTHLPNPVSVPTTFDYQDDGYVLYLGRLSEEKGVDVLVQAAAQVPNIRIKIAGEGPMLAMIESYIETHALQNVELLGFLSGSELEDVIARAAITVVPSLWYENNPLAILESCAQGNVVVGSDIGGIPEMLPESLLFTPGDPTDLAKTLSHWIEVGTDARQKMGQTLRARVQTHNDPNKHLASICSIYQTYISA